LTALVGGDEGVRQAHRDSVNVALNELEKFVQARIGGNHPAETILGEKRAIVFMTNSKAMGIRLDGGAAGAVDEIPSASRQNMPASRMVIPAALEALPDARRNRHQPYTPLSWRTSVACTLADALHISARFHAKIPSRFGP
jgi:hypothetical protein